MRHFKTAIATIALLVSLNIPALAAAQTAPISMVAIQGQSDACNGLSQLGGTTCDQPGSTPGQDQIAKVAKTVVNIISLIAGIAAVVLIVISGVKFITSGGDQSAIASARNTLIYAIIGLAVVALAQLIVHFVLNAILTGSTNTGTG